MKLREFQEKKYPSRFLDPNPDFRSRQKPFPLLFDPDLLKAYTTFCRRAGKYGVKLFRIKASSFLSDLRWNRFEN